MKNAKVATSMINASAIKADTSILDNPILGTYEGEALDTEITNKNGLDITRDVIEVVLDSEEYEDGIKYGWFIGFLGHPEDPNCMDFRNGCIVLTDMSITENGKVYAKFNLINTPVGQIVKTFQDAGVTFGISIRGAGDVIGNSVEPETFMFRGFDLVAFPAYPESIPDYTAIAASTDLDKRKKYQAICAAVDTNLDSITSCATIDVLQSQFAPQSEEYKKLDSRKAAIQSGATIDINAEKIEAMTDLYLSEHTKNAELIAENKKLRSENRRITSSCDRKVAAIERMTDAQIGDTLSRLDQITASCTSLRSRNKSLSEKLDSVKKSNLIYKQRIEACESELSDKDAVIASLQTKLRETITASTKSDKQLSNLDSAHRKLKRDQRGTQDELRACQEMLQSYQRAYLSFYASAVGIDPGSVSITASTSPEDIRSLIDSATNTSNMAAGADMVDDFYIMDDDDNGIISV